MTATARGELLAHLASLADRGHVAPCLTLPGAGWTAEDAEAQQFAAQLCGDCPAIASCGDYGRAFPKEFGVYGGMTDHERRPRLGRPRTHTDARKAEA